MSNISTSDQLFVCHVLDIFVLPSFLKTENYSSWNESYIKCLKLGKQSYIKEYGDFILWKMTLNVHSEEVTCYLDITIAPTSIIHWT